MYTGSLGAVSNRADWVGTLEIRDAVSNELLDLAGVDIALEVAGGSSYRNDYGSCCPSSCSYLNATTDNDKITIPDLGIVRWEFDHDEMRKLRPGVYNIGITLSKDDATAQLIIGEITVLNGVVN